MALPAGVVGKDNFEYQAPWTVYALHWSQQPGSFRLGLGSFTTDAVNKVQVLDAATNPSTGESEFLVADEVDLQYPCTKLQWRPQKGITGPQRDMFATSGDFLRLWQLDNVNEQPPWDESPSTPFERGRNGRIHLKTVFRNHRRSDARTGRDYAAPITSLDWNETDPSIIITSSIDTTCTVWDLNTQQAKTQLIAHDKEVFDVAFAKGTDVFASVGADGSLRMFDLRNLEHSTILYEAVPPPPTEGTQARRGSDPENSPLVRLAWNKQDQNYLATFQSNSSSILLLDIRVPAIPILELRGHASSVSSMSWAPHSSGHLCTGAEDSSALVWDISHRLKEKQLHEPMFTHTAPGAVNQVCWSTSMPHWIAVASGSQVQALSLNDSSP
ncbi:WD40-repeat-containing domain protein [Phlyctochytrium arcticum]|nr:WD40-repeat-containing domain protein [Phlyctochytrium arcticum]